MWSCGQRAYILGEYSWENNDGGRYGGTDVTRTRLTALLDHQSSTDTSYVDRNLTRVVKHMAPGGY